MAKDKDLMELDFNEVDNTNINSPLISELFKEDFKTEEELKSSNKDDDEKPAEKGEIPDGFEKNSLTFDPAELTANNPAKDIKSETAEEDGESKNNTPPQNTSKSSSSSFPYALVFKQLSEEGAVDYDEEAYQKDIQENGETEAVLNIWRNQAKKVTEDTLNELEEDVKVYLEMKNVGVDSATAGKIALDINKYTSIKDEDIEGEDNLNKRKEVLKEYYKIVMPKSTDDDIDELIEDKIATGKDEKEAKKAIKFLPEHAIEQKKVAEQAEKDRIADEQKQRAERNQKLQEYINNTDEFLKDVKVNKQTKQKMIDAIFKPYQVVNGQTVNKLDYYRLTKPEQFVSVLAYMAETGAFDGKWTKPVAAAKTSVINDLTNAIESSKKSTVSGKPNTNTSDDDTASSDFDTLYKKTARQKKY